MGSSLKMFVLNSGGKAIGSALCDEMYAAVVTMLRTGQKELHWRARAESCPVQGLFTTFEGTEASYAGQDGGPVVKVKFVTLEGREGWIRYIVPRRVLQGDFPDDLHEVLATVFTAADTYEN